MTNAIQKQQSEIIEQVVMEGDLSKLSPQQRMAYYNQVCETLNLNPYTRPFDYIKLNGKVTLYAKKDATDQLRNRDKISIEPPDIQYVDDWIVVTVSARTGDGRTDSDVGVVNRKDMQGNFGNALMKAVTKAKRRVTLSICGLGWLDETEIDAIPTAQPVIVDTSTGEIVQHTAQPANGAQRPAVASATQPDANIEDDCSKFITWARKRNGVGEPATEKQYQYLAGTVDAITGRDDHKAIFELLFGTVIDHVNPPRKTIASDLLDALLSERINTETGEKTPNPDYKPQAVACIRRLSDTACGQEALL